MQPCKICENTNNNKIFTAEEKMFGLKDKFEYLECSSCHCIQIIEVPTNLGKYYPSTCYYSFKNKFGILKTKINLSKYLDRIKANYLINNTNKTLGRLLCINYIIPDYYKWLKKSNASFDAHILDIGCGGGELLYTFKKIGFKNLTGVDPFVEKSSHENNIKIYKKDIFNVCETYDIVFMIHAFEHMAEPLSVLNKIYTILNADGYLVIQIPIAESYYWEKYGINWVHLDAPRHLYIHSINSIELLVGQTHFDIIEIYHDGTEFQFLASEQYLKGINLTAPNSYFTNKKKSFFTKEDVKKYREIAKTLNSQEKGGQATIILQKK